MPGPGSSGPILEWERQVKRKTMERPLPATTGLEDLRDRTSLLDWNGFRGVSDGARNQVVELIGIEPTTS